MTQLCIAQADHVAPGTKGPALIINPCFPCQLGHKMGRNMLEKLVQNGQFMRSWSLAFFHGLLFGRFSSKLQPLFLKILWDGCDLKTAQADAETVHDRYKDLALVERDFRTLKTGHLEFRPWFVCTEDNTQAHALTAMMALKVRRYLERAWWPPEVTVEEGLLELEQLSIMELVHSETGKVVARQMPEPNARQKQLLDALGLTVPSKVPEAKVTVVTRKKIARVRKTLAK